MTYRAAGCFLAPGIKHQLMKREVLAVIKDFGLASDLFLIHCSRHYVYLDQIELCIDISSNVVALCLTRKLEQRHRAMNWTEN